MANYVLVHGGGHGGWCWRDVARELRRQGHDVYAPTLTGLCDRAHLLTSDVGLETHITDIASLIEYEDLSDVTLVGHSYGGMVITGAADRAIERIQRLVYLDAAIPCDGEALIDVSPGLLTLAGETRAIAGVELGLFPDSASGIIYGVAGHACEQWAVGRLSPHPWKTLTDRLTLRDPGAVAALPRAIVNCRDTLARRPEKLRHRWSDANYVQEIDSAHDVMLTEPQLVARILASLAQ